MYWNEMQASIQNEVVECSRFNTEFTNDQRSPSRLAILKEFTLVNLSGGFIEFLAMKFCEDSRRRHANTELHSTVRASLHLPTRMRTRTRTLKLLTVASWPVFYRVKGMIFSSDTFFFPKSAKQKVTKTAQRQYVPNAYCAYVSRVSKSRSADCT